MTPGTFVVFAAVAGLGIIVAVVWRRALVMSLPFLVIFDGVSLGLGGGSVRLDQLAACALLVPLGASVLLGARRLRLDPAAWLLGAILALNIVSSALHSPARTYSIEQCASLASVWVIYVLLINFLDTRAEVESFVRATLLAGIAGSLLGVGAYALGLLGVDVGGAEVSVAAAERLTRAYGAYGTLLEPNLFGSFTAAFLVLAISLRLVAARRPSDATFPRLMRWVAVTAAIGLVLSFTRAAWLGAAVGVAWFSVYAGRIIAVRVRPWRVLAPLGGALALSVLLLLLPGDAGSFFRFKVLNLINVGSQTAVLRLLTYSMALQQSVDHLIIGWGTFSFAPLVAQGSDFQQFEHWRNLWIGDYLLLALHDTGIAGLLLWCALLWSVTRRGMRAARAMSVEFPVAATRTLALTAATLSMLIPFLTTSGFSLGYPWLFIGLLGAHCQLVPDEAPAPAPATPRDRLPLAADAT